jgi:FK506-binding protein 2
MVLRYGIIIPFWLQITSSAWQFPSRRQVLRLGSFLVASPPLVVVGLDDANVVRVQVQGPNDSLGIQVNNKNGQVIIQRVILPKSAGLKPGMRLQGYSSAQDLLTRLQMGPYPVNLEFVMSTGDSSAEANGRIPAVATPSSLPPLDYTKRVLQPGPGPCVIRSTSGDLLEIEYEATYWSANGSKKTLYDASDFRGTGQPYQMVLGSGDMIPGVDQGLADMCPGEIRQLTIPPSLAYGPRARDSFKIPADYRGVEWAVKLVSIEGVIRADNNNLTSHQREANDDME